MTSPLELGRSLARSLLVTRSFGVTCSARAGGTRQKRARAEIKNLKAIRLRAIFTALSPVGWRAGYTCASWFPQATFSTEFVRHPRRSRPHCLRTPGPWAPVRFRRAGEGQLHAPARVVGSRLTGGELGCVTPNLAAASD